MSGDSFIGSCLDDNSTLLDRREVMEMKREKIKTYIVGAWGRIEDLKEKVVYQLELSGEHEGKRVFIGKCQDVWFFKNGKYRYLIFDLHGNFLGEAGRFEMSDFDIRISRSNRKRKKLMEDIETFKRLQAEHKKRSEVVVKSDINA